MYICTGAPIPNCVATMYGSKQKLDRNKISQDYFCVFAHIKRQNYTAHLSRNDLSQIPSNIVRSQNKQNCEQKTQLCDLRLSQVLKKSFLSPWTNWFIAPSTLENTKTRWTYCLRVGPTIVKLAMASAVRRTRGCLQLEMLQENPCCPLFFRPQGFAKRLGSLEINV